MTKVVKRVLTGTRPSGVPHLGNYFGAFKNAIELQNNGQELFFFLADYHALNSVEYGPSLREKSLSMTATLLSLGLDPRKSNFYAQSMVPSVCELTWMLSCSAPYAFLLRAHAFKDALQRSDESVNMGLFNYPLLMAADILLYSADIVPVGKDQKQHVEMARDFAQRFNQRIGKQVLTLPDVLISEEVAVVPGLDGLKMSKSKNNVIPLFATDADWKKAVMAIVTDSKGVSESKDPLTCNVFKLFQVVSSDKEKVQDLANKYHSGGYGYGHAKQDLLKSIQDRFGKYRDDYFDWIKRPDDLMDVLRSGANKVRPIADQKLLEIKPLMGLVG